MPRGKCRPGWPAEIASFLARGLLIKGKQLIATGREAGKMLNEPGPHALRVAYCGPIARPGCPARGGYEAANRRLIDDLRLRGLHILELPYPVAPGARVTKIVIYARRFIGIAVKLMQQRKRFDLFHMTPLCWHFIYPEALLCMCARVLGKRVVFDIRTGCFVRLYTEQGPLYRALVDKLIRHVDAIALEGKEYQAFVEARRDGPIIYLPNYVSGRPAHSLTATLKRSSERLRLIFLSRVVPEKGIETAIDALECLLVAGFDAQLEVIGGGDPTYLSKLAERTRNLPVTWTGPLHSATIHTRIAAGHFFVFPTRHPGEGHSNALTEAMAEGLVPICSDQGFNCSVIADTGCLLPINAPGAAYAETIASIWRDGRWAELSAAARARVVHRFTSDVVLSDLMSYYQAAC